MAIRDWFMWWWHCFRRPWWYSRFRGIIKSGKKCHHTLMIYKSCNYNYSYNSIRVWSQLLWLWQNINQKDWKHIADTFIYCFQNDISFKKTPSTMLLFCSLETSAAIGIKHNKDGISTEYRDTIRVARLFTSTKDNTQDFVYSILDKAHVRFGNKCH